MNQAAFSFSSSQRPADPASRAVDVLRQDPLAFKAITEGWLINNMHVWETFFHKTEALRLAGRQHFGAKAIYESMRYDTAIQDAEITFKLNNSSVSGLARLYNAVTKTEYFETREVA